MLGTADRRTPVRPEQSHRAARIGRSRHGGQILVSGAAAAVVGERTPDDMGFGSWVSLGSGTSTYGKVARQIGAGASA